MTTVSCLVMRSPPVCVDVVDGRHPVPLEEHRTQSMLYQELEEWPVEVPGVAHLDAVRAVRGDFAREGAEEPLELGLGIDHLLVEVAELEYHGAKCVTEGVQQGEETAEQGR